MLAVLTLLPSSAMRETPAPEAAWIELAAMQVVMSRAGWREFRVRTRSGARIKLPLIGARGLVVTPSSVAAGPR